jgi:hypothetical protein
MGYPSFSTSIIANFLSRGAKWGLKINERLKKCNKLCTKSLGYLICLNKVIDIIGGSPVTTVDLPSIKILNSSTFLGTDGTFLMIYIRFTVWFSFRHYIRVWMYSTFYRKFVFYQRATCDKPSSNRKTKRIPTIDMNIRPKSASIFNLILSERFFCNKKFEEY